MKDKIEGFPDVREDYTSRYIDAPLTKGSGAKNTSYAKGGPVLQANPSPWAKPDPFRTDAGRQDYTKKTPGGELSNTKQDGKSLPPIKPRN